MKEIFDDAGLFLRFENKNSSNKFINNANNVVCNATKELLLNWNAAGLVKSLVEKAKRIFKDTYFKEAPPDLINNSVEMENDDSFVMDEPAAEINYADVFNERALSLARELRVKRTIGRPSIRRVWTDSPRVLVEITGHTWTIDVCLDFI